MTRIESWICIVAAAAIASFASEVASAQLAPSLSERFDQLARHPGAVRVVGAALRESSLSMSDLRARMSRARASGWAPRLATRVRTGRGLDLSTATRASGESTTTQIDESLGLEATLEWSLARLVFAPEEVALVRERRATADQRRAVAATVIGLYFERVRLLLASETTPSDEAVARVAEIEALLDAFTGGAWSRMMAEPTEAEP